MELKKRAGDWNIVVQIRGGHPMNEERKYWLDDPNNVRKVAYSLYATCGLLALLDLFHYKHPHFPFEDWFGFYGWFGFVSCVGLVLVAKALRVVLGVGLSPFNGCVIGLAG